MCVYACQKFVAPYVCVNVNAVYVCALGGQRLAEGVFLNRSPLYKGSQDLSLEPSAC